VVTRISVKKTRLEIEYSYDFELLGIASSARSYKLAWEVNRVLHVSLRKHDDLRVTTREGEFFFTFYSHQSAINTVNLFRNRSNESDSKGIFLVPEHPHLDYVLYSMGNEEVSGSRLQELLREIPSIELVAFLPLAALKSKDNFIF
jgi:hypothetical protein